MTETRHASASSSTRAAQRSILAEQPGRLLAATALASCLLWLIPLPALAQLQGDQSEPGIVAPLVNDLLEVVSAPDADPDAGVAKLEAMEADPTLVLADREHAWYAFAMQQREEAETVAGRRALEWLTGYESQALTQIEDRGPAILPVWRVAGVARGTLTLWDRAEPIPDVGVAMTHSAVTGDVAALTRSLEQAPDSDLAAHRAELLAMLEQSDAHARSVAAAALRLEDPELVEAVLASGDRGTAIRLIARVGEALPPDGAFPVLRDATAQADLASAALFAIARMAGELPPARDFLLESLGDPDLGGSAAAALAAMHDDAIVVAVADALETSPDETVQSKAVLTLVLSDRPLAQASLREYARRDDVPEALRRELDIWLEEGSR